MEYIVIKVREIFLEQDHFVEQDHLGPFILEGQWHYKEK